MSKGEAKISSKISVCCEVCAEDFSHEEGHVPKLISCGHSFCDGCLTKLQSIMQLKRPPFNTCIDLRIKSHRNAPHKVEYHYQYEIVCPKCKEKTVSDKPCSSLPKNYSYLDIIVEIAEVLEIEKNQPNCCKEHPNYVVDMFCHEEEEVICLYCASFGDHKGHQVSRLSGFSDHQRTSINYHLESLEGVICDFDQLCEELDDREQELTDKVEWIRKYILSKFDSVHTEVKRILDTKLESVLNQLQECSAIQQSLFEEARQTLSTEDLDGMQTRTETFLAEADECSIAKENVLCSDIQAKIDEAHRHLLCIQHVYDVQVDSADHIVKSLEDIVDAWISSVKVTKEASFEPITNVIDQYSPSDGDSMDILFGEKLPYELSTENPFGRIDCRLWCDGVLDNCIKEVQVVEELNTEPLEQQMGASNKCPTTTVPSLHLVQN